MFRDLIPWCARRASKSVFMDEEEPGTVAGGPAGGLPQLAAAARFKYDFTDRRLEVLLRSEHECGRMNCGRPAPPGEFPVEESGGPAVGWAVKAVNDRDLTLYPRDTAIRRECPLAGRSPVDQGSTPSRAMTIGPPLEDVRSTCSISSWERFWEPTGEMERDGEVRAGGTTPRATIRE
jgi:hypothetical protein